MSRLECPNPFYALVSFMAWSKWCFVCIYYENRHVNFLSDSGNPGDVCLDNVMEWFNARSTSLTLVLNAFASPVQIGCMGTECITV